MMAAAQSWSTVSAMRCSALQPSLWGVVTSDTAAMLSLTILTVMLTAIVARVGGTSGPYRRRRVASSTTPGSLKRERRALRVFGVASATPLLSARPAVRANRLWRKIAYARKAFFIFLLRVFAGRASLTATAHVDRLGAKGLLLLPPSKKRRILWGNT